ncbi:MAG: zinc-ribbon domain-containing protein [Bacteroidetes bacterium]|nr:zinc-ribbon domain-containing protein [Bacteroidota bacterium]
MIVYGWNTKILKQAPLENYECPNCHQNQSAMVIYARYVHIFWLPVFPYKKTATIVCAHCNHETEEKNITLGTKEVIQKLKATVPLPIYLFSGTALIVLAIAYFTYAGRKDSEREQAYLKDPHVGDVYLVKSKEEKSQYNHYLMKVRKVQGDSLWVSYSSFNYNGIVSKLDPKDGFYNVMYAIHKDGILKLSQSDEMKKVFRDYSSYTGFDQEIEYHEPDSVAK